MMRMRVGGGERGRPHAIDEVNHIIRRVVWYDVDGTRHGHPP